MTDKMFDREAAVGLIGVLQAYLKSGTDEVTQEKRKALGVLLGEIQYSLATEESPPDGLPPPLQLVD